MFWGAVAAAVRVVAFDGGIGVIVSDGPSGVVAAGAGCATGAARGAFCSGALGCDGRVEWGRSGASTVEVSVDLFGGVPESAEAGGLYEVERSGDRLEPGARWVRLAEAVRSCGGDLGSEVVVGLFAEIVSLLTTGLTR